MTNKTNTTPTDWRDSFDALFPDSTGRHLYPTQKEMIENFIHSLLEENTRRVKEEDLERAWDYVVEATRRESWGKAELKEALNPNTPT